MDDQGTDGAHETDGMIAAIDRVQLDVEKVEFWVCAFSGLITPVPDYDLDKVGPRLRAA